MTCKSYRTPVVSLKFPTSKTFPQRRCTTKQDACKEIPSTLPAGGEVHIQTASIRNPLFSTQGSKHFRSAPRLNRSHERISHHQIKRNKAADGDVPQDWDGSRRPDQERWWNGGRVSGGGTDWGLRKEGKAARVLLGVAS